MKRFAKSILSLLVGAAPAAGGIVPPSYDFDFVTIGLPGNAAYEGDPDIFGNPSGGSGRGRGSVGYEYRIARMEVTTAQWMEYVNTYTVQLPREVDFARPFSWGAVADNSYRGPGKKWKLNPAHPQAALVPVIGVSWREVAEFVNWLNNDKSSSLEAITHGAYDTSTLTTNADGTLNDQLTHDPDARYWIPTADEWLKAAHHDPNRSGSGMEGWWNYPYGSNNPPIPGPPGIGETSAGYQVGPDEMNPRVYPLGSYPDSVSPWGLLDVSGGASEWTEAAQFPGFLLDRGYDGARAGDPYPLWLSLDIAGGGSIAPPYFRTATNGLRVASSVPSPAPVSVFLVGMVQIFFDRGVRRGNPSDEPGTDGGRSSPLRRTVERRPMTGLEFVA